MKLVFATHNSHKLKEIQALLPTSIELLSLTDIECFDEIPETAHTIEGNAILKAKYVQENYGYNCFADDTGLEVDSLNGKPGVYSARYAGEEKSDQDNMEKLLQNMKNKSKRKARFKTVISLIIDNEEELFTGICEGEILKKPVGNSGFGYDPIFRPEGFDQSFAEMTTEEKNKISHRAKAINLLLSYLQTNKLA